MENKIIKNNAISAYLMFIVSGLFLFQKKDPNLNNDFVKKHTKSAFLLHLLILISFIIFGFFGLFKEIIIWNFTLNTIILISISIILFGALFLGMYRAYRGELFGIGDIFSVKSKKNLVDINKNENFGEKDKLTLIIAYIPFVGPIFTSRYSQNELIKEILKTSTFVTFIFCLLFINGNNNLNQIFILIYFIYVAFVGVNLFAKTELIIINLPKYFSFGEIVKSTKILLKYLKNYISGNFREWKTLEEEQNIAYIEDQKNTFNKMKDLPDLKGPKKIIYFPIFNLIFLFFKDNKFNIHIANALTITFLLILTFLLYFFGFVSKNIFILFLFPICFGIGNIEKIYYKIPFIYDIYDIFKRFLSFFKRSKKIISEKRKEVKEETLKVNNNSEIKKETEENKEK
ncbi:hypothetical protein D8B46_05990 [Candidatus Gracilibacteria bacterium]|nr:MAG: hypothetical protein D8B46_05990 [Candidatus Gracilibacteria bacterium]